MTADRGPIYSPDPVGNAFERVETVPNAVESVQSLRGSPQTIRGWLDIAQKSGIGPPKIGLWARVVALTHEIAASMFSLRETRYAFQTSRELLKLYWIVSASHPGLARREIYQKVVMARTGANAEDAETLLVRAEQSFATWPDERALTFSDVVHYLAVSEFLAVDPRVGTRINMGRLVAGRIPQSL